MKWREVKVGDVIDGYRITDVRNHKKGRIVWYESLTSTYWSFAIIWPEHYEDEARLKLNKSEILTSLRLKEKANAND